MAYTVEGEKNETLVETAQIIESEIEALRSHKKLDSRLAEKIESLKQLLVRIKQGEVAGLIHAAAYLAQRLPALDPPKPGKLLKRMRSEWAYEDLRDIASLYADEQSPYLTFHDQAQLTAIGELLEKEVRQWQRDKLEYSCIIHMIRTEYYGLKCELLGKRVSQLEERLRETRKEKYQHGSNKAKGRSAPYASRNAIYARVTFQLRSEVNRELVSTDYPEWRKRVLDQESGLGETTLRTAFERETGCKPTTKNTELKLRKKHT